MPNGSDPRVHASAGLAAIKTKLNTRPRKPWAGRPPRMSLKGKLSVWLVLRLLR